MQAATADREQQLEAIRAEAQAQTQAAKEGAATAKALLEEAQATASAENQRVAAEKAELDRQLKVAQVRPVVDSTTSWCWAVQFVKPQCSADRPLM